MVFLAGLPRIANHPLSHSKGLLSRLCIVMIIMVTLIRSSLKVRNGGTASTKSNDSQANSIKTHQPVEGLRYAELAEDAECRDIKMKRQTKRSTSIKYDADSRVPRQTFTFTYIFIYLKQSHSLPSSSFLGRCRYSYPCIVRTGMHRKWRGGSCLYTSNRRYKIEHRI